MKKEYVYRKESGKQEFVLDYIKPEELFYNDVFGDGFTIFLGHEYESLKKNILSVFETLSDEEKKIVIYRYGFDGEQESLKEFCEKNDLYNARVRFCEDKAVRKCRHPYRSKAFKSQYYSLDNQYIRKTESIDYKGIILDDIKAYFMGEENRSPILAAFLEKNGLDMQTETIKRFEDSIESLEFSVRAYNVLRRAGICTVDDLLYRVDEIYDLKNMGKKTLAEIMLKVGQIGSHREKRVVAVIKKNEERKHEIKYGTTEEIVLQVYNVMMGIAETMGNILEYELSFGLTTFLLYKGHFLIDTLFRDYKKVKEELHLCAFYTLEKELDDFMVWVHRVLNKEENSVQYFRIDQSIAKKILKQRALTYEQISDCCIADDGVCDALLVKRFEELSDRNFSFGISEKLLKEC